MTNKEFLEGRVQHTVEEGLKNGFDKRTATLFGEAFREGWLSAFGYMTDGGITIGELIEDITGFDAMYKEFLDKKFRND